MSKSPSPFGGTTLTKTMTITGYRLRTEGDSVAIEESTLDQLLSARGCAWSEFFYNKEDKPFGMNWNDYNIGLARMRCDLGIDAIEDECKRRGIVPKGMEYNRVTASFQLFT